MRREDFSSDFIWGTATAAYQVEGSTTADGRGPSIWDTFVKLPGVIADGTTGEVADDHYRRWEEDVDLMARLGVNAYRLSISWPRIQPLGTGPALQAGLDFYRRIAEACRERGIAPWVTLYHWDLPQALEDRGGWLVRDTAERFRDFSVEVLTSLGDVVNDWITVNEPHAAAFAGYSGGVHAPGIADGDGSGARAGHHLLLGHGLALAAAREILPAASRVGVTLDLWPMRPATDSSADAEATRIADGQNTFFLDPILKGGYDPDVIASFGETEWFAAVPEEDLAAIAAPIDFMGMNYYGSHRVAAVNPGTPASTADQVGAGRIRFLDDEEDDVSQMGWPIRPQGLVEGLRMIADRAPGLPLFITENGSAWPDELVDGAVDDVDRERYLLAHLQACLDARAEGLPLGGYFAWTLLDNFEWQFGQSRRFGLYHVDFATQQRTLKRSGRTLATLLGGEAGTSR